MWEYQDMANLSKGAYSQRKRPKSTFILTLNPPIYPPIQSTEKRLSHRSISSAWGQAVWIF